MGKIHLERSYYYDPLEKKGRYLLDEQPGLAGLVSSGLQKQAVKLAAQLPYAVAEEVLADLAGLKFAASQVWQLIQKLGPTAQAQPLALPAPLPPEEFCQNLKIPPTSEAERSVVAPTSLASPKPPKKGVGLAGVMVHIRGEGYKETKLGCFFEVGNYLNRQGQLQAHAKEQSYCFYLGGPEEFAERVVLEAKRRGFGLNLSGEGEVLGDGASWIWNLASEHFKPALQVIDWYHAKQHLWQAANLLFGEGSQKARLMVEVYGDLLYEGCADLIASGLLANLEALCGRGAVSEEKQELIHREAPYFRHNQFRMDYAKYREAGGAIGSGIVESGCKLFKQRFGGSGMRWNRTGAENLMPFRAAGMGNNFERFWQQLCPQS